MVAGPPLVLSSSATSVSQAFLVAAPERLLTDSRLKDGVRLSSILLAWAIVGGYISDKSGTVSASSSLSSIALPEPQLNLAGEAGRQGCRDGEALVEDLVQLHVLHDVRLLVQRTRAEPHAESVEPQHDPVFPDGFVDQNVNHFISFKEVEPTTLEFS